MCPSAPMAKSPVALKLSEETPDAIVGMLRGATTLMLCDLPVSLGAPEAVLQVLEAAGLGGDCDYLYLPRGYGRKSSRRCNGSVSAFLNFTSGQAAADAVHVFHNKVFEDKRVYVCRASSQGVASNLLHFRSVRGNKQVQETAWPWVGAGALAETKPTEVAAALGIEAELQALQAELDGKNSASAISTAASTISTAASTRSSKDLPEELADRPSTDHGVPTVTPDMVEAYALLLATLPTQHPAAPQILDDWWAGQLSWAEPRVR